jgi:osmotically-inducible protein OsmY
MKHTRYISAALALSCALVTGGAWAATRANDHEISRQVVNELYRDVGVGPNGLRVRTRDGVVRLSGSVGTEWDWRMAERQARDAPGVTDVQNDLTVLIR